VFGHDRGQPHRFTPRAPHRAARAAPTRPRPTGAQWRNCRCQPTTQRHSRCPSDCCCCAWRARSISGMRRSPTRWPGRARHRWRSNAYGSRARRVAGDAPRPIEDKALSPRYIFRFLSHSKPPFGFGPVVRLGLRIGRPLCERKTSRRQGAIPSRVLDCCHSSTRSARFSKGNPDRGGPVGGVTDCRGQRLGFRRPPQSHHPAQKTLLLRHRVGSVPMQPNAPASR
jgi:hypothetical protein